MVDKFESLTTQLERTLHYQEKLQNEVRDNTPSYLCVHSMLYEYGRFDGGRIEIVDAMSLFTCVWLVIGVVLEFLLLSK